MANRVRGEVGFEADGKSYTLRYSTNALCELEDHFNQPINAIIGALQDKSSLRITMIRAVVLFGLRDKQPDMTELAAGEIISAVGLAAMVLKVGEALKAAFPDAIEGERPQ
jgi:hypothetical protein